MLFNSIAFAIFLPIVFLLYWFVVNRNLAAQNGLLLIASYVFYGFWDYRFLLLLAFSTVLDYVSALQIQKASGKKRRQYWFWLSIIVNLGFLSVFKYYNFFIGSAQAVLSELGITTGKFTIAVILPVGISFYTFHGLSYIIDIYNRKIKAETDFMNYAVFVSFFPLLVAGPIERANHLLPQIQKPRFFSRPRAVDGMRQILWGLFKKMVIADTCAVYVNNVFENPVAHTGSTILVAVTLFAFQIYCDFSGYSDIAIGTAKLFGISLLRNFAFPYFSRDIAEFWRRWHMSLSSWFRDYVYIPFGGSKQGLGKTVKNIFIIFLLSGLWHGANWTFVVWGLINALYFIPLLLLKKNRHHLDTVSANSFFPTGKELIQILTTFLLTTLAWLFFRATTIQGAWVCLKRIFSRSLFTVPETVQLSSIVFICILLLLEWVQRLREHPLQFTVRIPAYVRWGIYYMILTTIYMFGAKQQQFIYFKF